MLPAEWSSLRLPQRDRVYHAQQGQVLLLILLVLGMVGAALVYGFSPTNRAVREHDQRTAVALAQVRDALLGSAVSEDNRPGALPCPDTNNDGSADGPIGLPGNNCQSYLGRLPWRTLGLPDIRDGAGERLWYALSPVFRDYQSAGILNPDTTAALSVKDTSGTVKDQIVAVIFAPGQVVGAQTRIPNSADENNPAMYLDGDNGAGGPVYVAGPQSSSFNDRLIYITREMLFNGVGVRVAKEVHDALEQYRAAGGSYPPAVPYDTSNCTTGTFLGRVPVAGCDTGPGKGKGGSGTAPISQLPSWFAANNWSSYTHYAVASACTDPAAQASCISNAGTNPLVVSGVSTNAAMLVIVSGRTTAACSGAQCLFDASNADGDSPYVKPSRFPTSDDHMALTCSTSAPCSTVP